MFTFQNNVYTSSALAVPGVRHAFSTRLGGVSDNPATGSMNVAFGRGDGDEVVRRNIGILAAAVGATADDVVCAPQIHSDLVRFVTDADRGEGVTRDAAHKGDGFFTNTPGVALLVRTADCTPVLLAGLRGDGKPAVAAVHAGWRGAAQGIAMMAVFSLRALEVEPKEVYAAIGPCASFERYEVGEDMRDEVLRLAGSEIAAKYVREIDGKLHADVAGMNREFLLASGVPEDHVDVAGLCTMGDPARFHSHRASRGNRGAMGNIIMIEQG